MDGRPRKDRAVVLGASIAGLLAARVLSETYREVTLVERDANPHGGPRRGVPHARHIHGLQAGGQQIMDGLFPGFTRELAERGAPLSDVLADIRWLLSGHRLKQAPAGLLGVQAGRPLLEQTMRDRVEALPNVRLLEEHDVVGPVWEAEAPSARARLPRPRAVRGVRVTGVRVVPRTAGGGHADTARPEGDVLPADLVVDATGRGSRTPVWLAEMGMDRPREERIPVDIGYATRVYRLRPGALGDDLAVIPTNSPEHPRSGVMAVQEGGRCVVSLSGVLGDHPPTDEEGFLAFARSLRWPDIHDAIHDAEPLDEGVTFRFPTPVRRHYERLRRFPSGLLPLGDSVCSFNPLYGQGMSVAALQATVLRRHAARPAGPQPLPYLREVSAVIDGPWQLASSSDRAHPGVPGRSTRGSRLVGSYLARLHAAAAHDAELGRAFIRVAGMVDGPQTLFRPSVVLRVWRGQPGRRRASPAAR